jgi:hypothetical protein
MTIMHAIICKKEQFGPFGWHNPGYEFSPNDFEISVSQLVDIFMPLNENARVPCLLIHHIVTHLNYGSVVTNDFDLANLSQSTRAFISNDMFFINEGAEDPISYDLCGT